MKKLIKLNSYDINSNLNDKEFEIFLYLLKNQEILHLELGDYADERVWKVLEGNNTLKTLTIMLDYLSKQILHIISSILYQNSLKSLILINYCGWDKNGIEKNPIFEALSVNLLLEDLYIGEIQLNDFDFSCLQQIMIKNRKLKSIRLFCNGIRDLKPLYDKINEYTSLEIISIDQGEYVNLDYNFLKYHKNLKRLELFNFIVDMNEFFENVTKDTHPYLKYIDIPFQPLKSKLNLMNSSVTDFDLADPDILLNSQSMSYIMESLINYPNLNMLNIKNNMTFDDLWVQHLSKILRTTKTLKILNMENTLLEKIDLSCFLHALDINETLEILNLQNNCFNSFEKLGNVLGPKRNLKELELEFIKGEEEVFIRFMNGFMVNQSIEYISFDSFPIDEFGSKLLSKFLKENKSLKSLSLFRNYLSNEGISNICNSLEFNQNLLKLKIRVQSFDSKGIKEISNLLIKNSTINKVLLDLNFDQKGMNSLSHAIGINRTIISCSIFFKENENLEILIEHLFYNYSIIKFELNQIDKRLKNIVQRNRYFIKTPSQKMMKFPFNTNFHYQ